MTVSPAVTVRPATWDDRELLLGWANDPITRANSFDPRPIERDEHLGWLRRTLDDPEKRIYVGLVGSAPYGVVRFEPRDADLAEVSITLDPSFRGRGLAAPLLEVGRARYLAERGPRRVLAQVKSANEASLRAFERAGYREARRANGVVELEII
jgi:RimJ/RimL family protein N-acetyltransferase